MKSPESMSSQEGKWKWENCSVQRCKAIWDILAQLEEAVALPEGKTVESLERVGDIMDFAERVASDEQFWASIPEDAPTRLGDTEKRDYLKKRLSELIEESR